MPFIDVKCNNCEYIIENQLINSLPINEEKEQDFECSKCKCKYFKRSWTKSPAMLNFGEYEPGRLKDWRQGKTNSEIANIIADDSVPVK